MSNREKKIKRTTSPHDYVAKTTFIHYPNGRGLPKWFFTGQIVYESDYEKLSNTNKKKCQPLPPEYEKKK